MNKKRKILFITRLFYPHVGGVEKQVLMLCRYLIKKGYSVSVITEKYDSILKDDEVVEKIHIYRIHVLKMKYFGLFSIWLSLFMKRKLIQYSDIVHIHSVYIWYWPFRLLYPHKPNYVTFHGWEGKYPIPKKNIFIRKIDALLANGNIAISDFIEKHYGIKANKLMYTSVIVQKYIKKSYKKKCNKNIIYVGRLDEDTGIRKILKTVKYLSNHGFKIEFCGDGVLRSECNKFGYVHGFSDPNKYLSKAFFSISPGISSILEAFTHKCLVATIYNNPVKKDYLLMTPFRKWIVVEKSPQQLSKKIIYFSKHPDEARKLIDKAYEWVKTQNWDNAVRIYEDLWNI